MVILLTMPMSQPNPLVLLRRAHQAQLVDLLRRRGELTRAQLRSLTGLSRTALSEITATLIADGVVTTAPAADSGPRGRGRPAELLRLAASAGRVLGVDFHHRRVRAVVVNAAQQVIGSAARPYQAGAAWPDRIALALDMLDELVADDSGVRLGALERIGVGVTGPLPAVEDAAGERRPSEPTAEVTGAFTDRFGVPVLVDNNTRLTALGEATRGAAAGVADLIYVQLSYGVGGGLVLGGRLVRGTAGTAGEVGHVPVEPDGPACACGGRGCLEQYASLPPVMARAGFTDTSPDGARAFLDAVTDPTAPRHRAAVASARDAGRYLGHVLAGLCNMLSPQLVVIGGELGRAAGDVIGDAVRGELRTHVLAPALRRLEVRPARLGDEGGALGAVAYALQGSPLLAGYPVEAYGAAGAARAGYVAAGVPAAPGVPEEAGAPEAAGTLPENCPPGPAAPTR